MMKFWPVGCTWKCGVLFMGYTSLEERCMFSISPFPSDAGENVDVMVRSGAAVTDREMGSTC